MFFWSLVFSSGFVVFGGFLIGRFGFCFLGLGWFLVVVFCDVFGRFSGWSLMLVFVNVC